MEIPSTFVDKLLNLQQGRLVCVESDGPVDHPKDHRMVEWGWWTADAESLRMVMMDRRWFDGATLLSQKVPLPGSG